MRRNGVVHMQEEVGETRGEVRQETSRKVAQVLADRFGEVLVVVFLESIKREISSDAPGRLRRRDPLTLFRKTRSKSRRLEPSYFRYLPRLSSKVRSSAFVQSSPTISSDFRSSVIRVGVGGSRSMISNRSEASQMNSNRF